MSVSRAIASSLPSRYGRRRAGGFTLIELLVVVTVTAVLLAVAAPSLQDVSVRAKVSDNANRLAISASLARGEAIKRNTRTTMCMSTDGATCATSGGWEQGWIITYVDPSGTTQVITTESAAPNGYLIREGSSTTSLVFQPTSVGTTAAQWTICRSTPSVNSQQRVVNVSPTGRASVSKKTSTTCP
jgi:type IV fimbrial biogenesis protein FimT